MSWSDVWKICISIVGALGGLSVILVAIVRYMSSIIADRLSKRYELKLSKELEDFKSKLENKTYISKTKFDTEFSIYRDLSSDFFDAVKAIGTMIPTGLTFVPADKEDQLALEKQHYDIAHPAVLKAQDSLKKVIPFISEDSYNEYNEILGLMARQLHAYEDRFVVSDMRPQSEKERFSLEDYKRTDEIYTKWNNVNRLVREYLKSLEVVQ